MQQHHDEKLEGKQHSKKQKKQQQQQQQQQAYSTGSVDIWSQDFAASVYSQWAASWMPPTASSSARAPQQAWSSHRQVPVDEAAHVPASATESLRRDCSGSAVDLQTLLNSHG
jgi:hypothetical protein